MKTLFWILGGALLAAGALVGLGIWLVYFPPIGESYRRVATDDLIVALTYDDGPNPPYTDQILEIFNRRSAKATFFMMGRHAELHPDTVRRPGRLLRALVMRPKHIEASGEIHR